MKRMQSWATRALAAGSVTVLAAGSLLATGGIAQAMELESATGESAARPTVVSSQQGRYSQAVVDRDLNGACQLEAGARAGIFTAGAYQPSKNKLTDGYASQTALIEWNYLKLGLDPATPAKQISLYNSTTGTWYGYGHQARCIADTDGDGIDSVFVPNDGGNQATLRQGTGVVNVNGVPATKSQSLRYQWGSEMVFDRSTPANGAGDVDGDGLNDFVVADRNFTSADQPDSGMIWVLRGENVDAFAPGTFTRDLTGTLSGATVWATIVGPAGAKLDTAVSAGDVNGDGIGDLLISSSASGSAWIVYGRAAGDGAHTIDLAQLAEHEGFEAVRTTDGSPVGSAIDATSDVTGDGISDLIIGTAPHVDGRGGVAIIRGPISGTRIDIDPVAGTVSDPQGSRGLWIAAEQADDGLGYSVAALADVNGDGKKDVIIGAPGYDAGGVDGLVNSGAAYVLHGLPAEGSFSLAGLDESVGYRIDGEARDAEFWGPDFLVSATPVRLGVSVADVGDVDGNGAGDFAINAQGVPSTSYPYYSPGQVHVALRGELATSAEVVGARVSGVKAVNLSSTDNVLDASSEKLSLRGNLRASTLDGISQPISFTIDGAPIEQCGMPVTQADRALTVYGFGYCEDVSYTDYGKHQLRTEFAGAPGMFGPSTSAALSFFVSDHTSVDVANTSGAVDRPTRITATVAAASSAKVVDGGTVDFFTVGASAEQRRIAECQNVMVEGGSATCELVPDNATELRVQAKYSGLRLARDIDQDDTVGVLDASVSAAATVRVLEVADLSVAVSKPRVAFGDKVRFSVAAPQTATGTVDVRVDGKSVAQTEVSGGRASVQLADLGIGTHTVTAHYSGDEKFAAAVSADESLEITQASVALATPQVSAASQPYGAKKAATVSVQATGLGGGSLELFDGKQSLGFAKISSGQAKWTLPSSLQVGGHTLRAQFAGSKTHQKASSAKAAFTVRKDAPRLKLAGPSFAKGTAPKVTVTVGSLASGAAANGKITLRAGSFTKTVSLRASHQGKVTVTLPKRSSSVTVQARFAPGNSATTAPVSAKTQINAR